MVDDFVNRAQRVTAPGGEVLDVLGRAGAVRRAGAPHFAAQARDEPLVVKQGRVFVVSHPNGDVDPGRDAGAGIYADDTRFISDLRLRIGGKPPLLLSSSANNAYEAYVDLTNPELVDGDSRIPHKSLHLRRARLVDECVRERVEVANQADSRAKTELKLSLGADFADVFDVRGAIRRKARGRLLAPRRTKTGVLFGYVGEDHLFRQTFVIADPAPDVVVDAETATFQWTVDLQPRDVLAVTITIEPSLQGGRSPCRPMEAARENSERLAEVWRHSCARVMGLHPSFNRVIEASVRDLRSLTTVFEGHRIVTAGIPWYVAPFGRDALITCLEMMLLNSTMAGDALRFLALHQARADDPERDAEPGKILHELRYGELARSGHIPHTPYYGTVDATPLFVMLAAAYYSWTADRDTLSDILPALDAALVWMDGYGDRDGDGFLEYKTRARSGLYNQGWKDSGDAVVHIDGSLAEPPIAVVEVQCYAYLAKYGIADVYEALGHRDRAESLRRGAAELKDAFNEAFWMEDEGTYALALDGKKRQVRSVTSNPGHALYSGIVDEGKARRVAERLMAKDMFSGWGVRTLSTASPAYNPMSYHNGSVWPHDNAIIAAGLKRYAFTAETEKIVSALFEVALHSRDARLPELLCGFDRREEDHYVPYPVACRPQAWSASAPFMILQALLGISAKAQEGLLTVNLPQLPEWLGSMEIRNIRVGEGTASLAFTRSQQGTAVHVLDAPEMHGSASIKVDVSGADAQATGDRFTLRNGSREA